MKEERLDIRFLLSILVLFGVSVGILHGRKKIKNSLQFIKASVHPFDEISLKEAYKNVHHLLVSHSIATLVQVFDGVSAPRTIGLAHLIVKNKKSPLSFDEKNIFLLGLVNIHSDDMKVSYQLFDFMEKYKLLYKGQPIVLLAARSEYDDVMPLLLSWMADRRCSIEMIEQALNRTIDDNDIEGLRNIIQRHVPITTEQATNLLARVVLNDKDERFVLLITDLGVDQNYVVNHHTLLMVAVENNNKKMTQVLLNYGADKNIERVIDVTVGSALQIAIAKGSREIVELLRDYGARA